MKIAYKEVEEYCNEMHKIANSMNKELITVEEESKKITSTESWSGKAAQHYVDRVQKLVRNFDNIYKEMEYAILFMAKCSDGYAAVDKSIMDEICENLNISEPNLDASSVFSGS